MILTKVPKKKNDASLEVGDFHHTAADVQMGREFSLDPEFEAEVSRASGATPLGLRGSERAIIFMNNDWPKVRGISSQKFAANWPGLIRIPTPPVWKSSPTIQLCIRLLTCVQPALVAGAATPSLHRVEPPAAAHCRLAHSLAVPGAASDELRTLLNPKPNLG